MADEGAWDEKYHGRSRVWSGRHIQLPEIPPGHRVLDLGCGDGRSVPAMVMRGWNAVGIDISPAAARLSRKAALGTRGTGTFGALAANAASLPFRDSMFDAVIAHHILGHLDTGGMRRAAGEIARVLRCGGRVYFLEFSQEDFRFGKGTMTGPGTFLRGDGIFTHYFCEDEVRDLFSELREEWLGKTQWCIRISGTQYQRSEISAIFAKKE